MDEQQTQNPKGLRLWQNWIGSLAEQAQAKQNYPAGVQNCGHCGSSDTSWTTGETLRRVCHSCKRTYAPKFIEVRQ